MSEKNVYNQDFELGNPEVVCRWRLSGGNLPLGNRHLRALSARTVAGSKVTNALVSWAKQHIEWTLKDGSAAYPDGVLMLMIDNRGRAAMTVGPYAPLERTRMAALLGRAESARKEAAETGVAPETMWIVKAGELVWCPPEGSVASGAASLIEGLAKTLGIVVKRDASLLDHLQAGIVSFDEAFLVSDEHGVVLPEDASGPEGKRFSEGFETLLARTRD